MPKLIANAFERVKFTKKDWPHDNGAASNKLLTGQHLLAMFF
jgi:hypothetical protein